MKHEIASGMLPRRKLPGLTIPRVKYVWHTAIKRI